MQLTSYGGKLTYTVKFQPGHDSSPDNQANVEISGNNIVLQYRARETPFDNTYAVPIREVRFLLWLL